MCVWEPLASDDHPPPLLQSTACCCCTRGLLAGKVSKAPALRLVTAGGGRGGSSGLDSR